VPSFERRRLDLEIMIRGALDGIGLHPGDASPLQQLVDSSSAVMDVLMNIVYTGDATLQVLLAYEC
jgi:hypothetical protein